MKIYGYRPEVSLIIYIYGDGLHAVEFQYRQNFQVKQNHNIVRIGLGFGARNPQFQHLAYTHWQLPGHDNM